MSAQPTTLLQQITDVLAHRFQVTDPEAQVQVRRTSLGWLHLRVVTSVFSGLSLVEREQHIDEILSTVNLNLGGFPFAGYELLTPQEANAQPSTQPIQLPLWSEILMAPEPERPAPTEEEIAKRPFVVTFYSFKGGVGRTTALGLVAGILAMRERRVVMIDFDLEAPGLSLMFPTTLSENKTCGVLDYLHQRYLTPDQNEPPISGCLRQISVPFRGELYLVPAGEYDEGYIHRLADLDVRRLYQRETNPVHQLLDDIATYMDPDVILIDARTGFTEMGAIALFDCADLGIICFSPTDQSFAGLKWVVQAANKQRSYRGIPDLRFLLTPMPPVDPGQLQTWTAQAEEWIAEAWGVPTALTVTDLYTQVPYNPAITTLSNLAAHVPGGILEPYMPIADAITASLPEMPPSAEAQVSGKRELILKELTFRAATAQEMEPKDIPEIFQRTGDFPKFLSNRTWLVRGAKGTGKSLLFRLFVERSEDAVKMAAPDVNLQGVTFTPGHGREGLRNTLLSSTDLASYEQQAGTASWMLFWLNYAILQLCAALPEPRSNARLDSTLIALCKEERPNRSDIVTWLVKRAQDPMAGPHANDEIQAIDQWLGEHRCRVWLLYDELDVGFGQDSNRRLRALEALFGWWIEISSGLKHITPKILLREDIWNNLNFTNKGHFSGRSLQLRWEEDDLWRLVLRQALKTSQELARLLEQFGAHVDRLNGIELGQLRKSLYPLWGERMGRGNKAYTYNWVRNRITDSQDNRFPRSLIVLLHRAVEREKTYAERNPYETVLRPRALIESLPSVSEQRVDEVRNEYPEFDPYLTKLKNERSPISLEHLSEIWGIQGADLNTLVSGMKNAGILQEYVRQPKTEKPRYSVAELYLYGLQMTRMGQR